jgi:hypothetical protein
MDSSLRAESGRNQGDSDAQFPVLMNRLAFFWQLFVEAITGVTATLTSEI